MTNTFNLEEVRAMIHAIKHNPDYQFESTIKFKKEGFVTPMDTFVYSKVDDHKIIQSRTTPTTDSVNINDIISK